jgi:hypothetical protein
MEQFRLMMRGISKSYGNAAALQEGRFLSAARRGARADWGKWRG